MELQFNKVQNRWEAEFEATADFNLHIEGVLEKDISVFQRGTASGYYALVRDSRPNPTLSVRVYDYDFAALVYPKYIKVSCATEPNFAEVVSNGEVTEGGGSGGSSILYYNGENEDERTKLYEQLSTYLEGVTSDDYIPVNDDIIVEMPDSFIMHAKKCRKVTGLTNIVLSGHFGGYDAECVVSGEDGHAIYMAD